ncbi:MAG: SET domain-containing protein, partial [Armatimonadetes bacterium]|nr:SET domain-containing protein [Anaerolineae bacterium]
MLHPLVVLVENDAIHGTGLRTTGLIKAGEVVSRLDEDRVKYTVKDVLTWSPEAQADLLHFAYQMREDLIVVEIAPERYMNHSCDANTWWSDDDTMIARRDIQAGEEITYDYATTEVTVPYAFDCLCGSNICRKRVTNLDHLIPAWQAMFGDHLPQHTLKAIA